MKKCKKTGVKDGYEHKIAEWRKLFGEAVNELNYRIGVTSFRESAGNKMSSGEAYILRAVNDSSGGCYSDKMVKLGVNIDHIATIRQARKEDFPSVIKAAAICEKSGADGITVHLREDRRHIQDEDVYDLRKSLKIKLNLEMAASEEIVKIALDVKPDFVCMVPEKRQELTTEGGLDVKAHKSKLASIVARLQKAGIIVSVFIDANTEQVLACSEIKADSIELHTGKYAKFFKENGADSSEFKEEMERLSEASRKAVKKGLILNAGHGLDYDNVERICNIPGMNEFNIGFSIIAESVFAGLETAVRNMKELISKD